MLYWGVILAFAVGFGTVMYLTPKLLLLSLRKHIVDPVSNRKIHTTAASRMGGVSFFPALLLAVGLSVSLMYFIGFRDFPDGFFGRAAGVFGALLMLYALGVRDDMADVAYQKKFLVQFLASAVVVFGGVWIRDLHGVLGIGELPACVGMPLTVFLLIFVTNAINLIDGIDGLAAALSILALAVYGTLFLADAQLFDALLVFAALGALLPFFYYNVFSVRRKNGSKIFMGDAGSVVIGFVLAVAAVELWNRPVDGASAPYAAVLSFTMLIVPGFDVVRVLWFRLRNRRPLFRPDNSHIHHQLMAQGRSQRQTLVILILTDLSFLLLNLGLAGLLGIVWIVLADILWAVLLFGLMNRGPRNRRAV